MEKIINLCVKAKEASKKTAQLTTNEKNEILMACSKEINKNVEFILKENDKDVEKALENDIKNSYIDRLKLTEQRVSEMASGLISIAKLNDPCGLFDSMNTLPNGLLVGKKRVPLGVVAMIYEARPNVTCDAFALCLKSGNATILRGGKEAINTNRAIVKIIQDTITKLGFSSSMVQLVNTTSRKDVDNLMKQNEYIDVLIPRGGAGLIQNCVKNSTIPVIQTGVGNCHIFVDKTADITKAVNIIINAKVQRTSVCNSCETVLIHKDICKSFLPIIHDALKKSNVEIRGCQTTSKYIECTKATEEDWETEYLDYIIAIKVVENLDMAIEHIEKFGTGHSESIITENYTNAQRFLNEVDGAAIYVNASTRFTDGSQFGFGAEIGISTQKLHARGPMGLYELTTNKYVIYGDGQIRL